jgi:hypothetical protein
MKTGTKRHAIGMTIMFGAIAMSLWSGAPRLMSDFRHAGDFVPAQSRTITDYKCKNWNFVIVSECTVTFVSPPSRDSQQITDWRFGPAPRDPVRLLQRRDDASSVTTDVSLRTLWNRIALGLTLVLFGLILAAALLKTMKAAEVPIGMSG